jgi:V-ATPase subunit C
MMYKSCNAALCDSVINIGFYLLIVAFALRRIELPTGLMVGTLDSLMSLSDELVRVDSLVENVVRKVSGNNSNSISPFFFIMRCCAANQPLLVLH